MLDEDTTLGKEIRIQAEMYRILRNLVMEGFSLIEAITSQWSPDDVLIEASISLENGATKAADLVLMGRRNSYGTGNRKPLMVIEIKKRRLTHLTQSYGAALKQARQYAHMIGCPLYAVYDGHTLILMQIPSPFLIGLSQWSFTNSTRRNREFAQKLWGIALQIQSGIVREPVAGFRYHSDFEPWKKSIYYFIRDAFRFKVVVDQGMSSETFDIEGEAELLAQRWHNLYNRR